MFIGRYYHTVEAKGRLSLPKPFRSQNSLWVITRGLDGGLFLFAQDTFERRLAEIADRTFTKKRDRDFIRLMTNDAHTCEVDANGRVRLPEYLREFAGINREVAVVGSYGYIEIWDVERYHQYIATAESQAEIIAESVEITND